MANPPPQPDAAQQAVAALAAYQAQTGTLRVFLEDYLRRLWASLGTYRAKQMRMFVDQVVPVVAGAQMRISALTAAMLAAQQQLMVGGLGVPHPVSVRAVSGASVRNGASPRIVYERPFHLVWRQLDELPHEVGSIEQAIDAGLSRGVNLAMTDLQLAKTATAQRVTSADKNATGYRRVLEGPHSCALCIVAATRRYHKRDLMPIHPGCDCSVQPLYDEDDGGPITATVNVDGETVPVAELADVHERVQERFGISSSAARAIPRRGLPDYNDLLIVHEHGELGPILAVRGRPFLGPNDL